MRLKILNPSAEIELFYNCQKCPFKPSFLDNGWTYFQNILCYEYVIEIIK